MDTCTLGRENRMRITWRKADGKVGGQRDSHLWCSRDWFTTWLFTSHVHVSVRAPHMCHESAELALTEPSGLALGDPPGFVDFQAAFAIRGNGWLDMTQAMQHGHRSSEMRGAATRQHGHRRCAATRSPLQAPTPGRMNEAGWRDLSRTLSPPASVLRSLTRSEHARRGCFGGPGGAMGRAPR